MTRRSQSPGSRHLGALPPHPATVVQRSTTPFASSSYPPHPATVSRAKTHTLAPKAPVPRTAKTPTAQRALAPPRPPVVRPPPAVKSPLVPRPTTTTTAARRPPAQTLYVRSAGDAITLRGAGTIQRWSYLSSAASTGWNAISTLSHTARIGVGALAVAGGIAVGATLGGFALGAAGTAFLANSAWDAWENRRTTERISDVPGWVLSDDDDRGGFLVPKTRDVELTAVSVRLEPSATQGRVRNFGMLEMDEKSIHVDRVRGQEMVYLPSDILIRRIDIGRGRRPTRYDPDQADHTVAWTLITLSLEALAGRTVEAAMQEVLVCCRALARVPDQTHKCLDVLRQLEHFDVELLRRQLTTDKWGDLLARFIDLYLTAQQLGIESTYRRTGKKTIAVKLEADAIRTMMQAEQEFYARGRSSLSARAIAEGAEGLLDVGFNLSLEGSSYAYAVADWLRALNRAFPNVMADATVGAAVRAQVLDRAVAPTYRPRDDIDTVRAWLVHLGLRAYAGF